MNGFLRRLLNLDTLDSALTVAARQHFLIEELNKVISDQQELFEELNKVISDQQELFEGLARKQQLEYARSTRDLIEAFFVIQQSGDDVRDSLLAGLQDLRDEVARLEEHSST